MSALIQRLAAEAVEQLATKDRRIADLEARLEGAEARSEIRGQSAMQMVIAITLIARACPKAGFREIHEMWAAHADADNAEKKREDAANAGVAALASWLGDWIAAGAPAKKCLCACLEPGCPTFDKTYVPGRGFVDRWQLAEEAHERELAAQEAAAAELIAMLQPEPAPAAAPAPAPARLPTKMTWAQIAAAMAAPKKA